MYKLGLSHKLSKALWENYDINDVLTKNTGKMAIQGIVLKLQKQEEAYWNPECFSKVLDLKLLIIDNIHLLHEPKYLPNALRYLDWSGYRSKYFPSSFQLKPFDGLKFIQLKNSLKLIETHDFNEIPNLEKLVLEGCINLRSLHPSIGVHKKLTFLNLKDHIWLLYLLPQFYQCEDIKSLWECNANGFSQIGIKILSKCWDLKTNKIIPSMVKVKKCGLRMVFKKDIEDLNETMAERSNNSITPYEGLDVSHHNFDNSIAIESYKAKLTHDDYEGAGSSNYEPHPKRIESS
nr:tmv resistance protein n [Quercus suber]